MKYLHIVPPWYVFHKDLRQPNVPLGAAYCARAALTAGWQATIWNGDLIAEGKENQYSEEMGAYETYIENMTSENALESHLIFDNLRYVIGDIQPDAVGITTLTPSYPSALICAKLAKEASPNCKVIMGGPHASALSYQVAKEKNVDIVVEGEGETALIDILNRIRSKDKIDEFWIRKCAPVEKLDTLGWPAKGTIYDQYGLLNRDNFGLLMYSRGCPFDCHFCASKNVWSRQVRHRTSVNMMAEMMGIHNEYDTRYFSFQDDTFTLNKKAVTYLLDAIIINDLPSIPGFRWTCNTRPELLDRKLLERMKQAGCAAVAIGIEFGSKRMLEKARKGFTIEDVKNAVTMIKEFDMIVSGQFMFGYPTETIEEMFQTVALADALECESIMLSVATPLPKTELYQEAIDLNLIPKSGIDWAKITTKNNGILMTVEKDGDYLPMPLEERQRTVSEIQAEFDRIQAKTLDAKNESRLGYERQYLPEDELMPVYGIRK